MREPFIDVEIFINIEFTGSWSGKKILMSKWTERSNQSIKGYNAVRDKIKYAVQLTYVPVQCLVARGWENKK